MTTQTCPDRTTLENFLLGKLTAADQSAISEHLLNCTNCTAAANTLSPQDEITRAIRSRKVLSGDESAVVAAAEKGKLLSSQLQTMPPDETVIGDKPQVPPVDPNATITFAQIKTNDEALSFLAPAQSPDELGRLGDYRILELLGMGGMGMVFRAEDARLKRQVALKVMKPSVAASRTAKDRFLREAQFTAAIEHDNIVQIFQVGEDNDVPFIAMPFLKGESLKTRQERVGRMSQKDVLKVGIQVAAGLAAAHERNLIHRDIKPDNIWIEEKTGRAKILDFGLVRATSEDAGLTQSGMVMGTPRYMAPEQALGQDVDHRCDLFSLGSVLYHLASGKLPFQGSNVTATLMAVVQKEPKPLQTVIQGLDPALCDMIARLMSKHRDDRPQKATEVAKGLTAILQRLKHGDAATPKAEAQPIPATTEAARNEDGVLPVIVTQKAFTPFNKDRTVNKDKPTPVAAQPPGKPPRRRLLAAAGAGGILLALLGIIVITIRDKDGNETVIRVPEGTEIDVKADPGSKVTIRQEDAGQPSKPAMAAAAKPADSAAAMAKTNNSVTFTPPKPMVEIDLTPAEPLGTWKMGPEPPWFEQGFQWFQYSLRDADVLPGILDRPAVIPGIKRWNVDTVWPRGGVRKVAYSPDGNWIGVLDAHLHLYDAKTLKLKQILPGFCPQVGAFDFSWSPDSRRIAVVADQSAILRIFDIEGSLLHEIAPQGGVNAVAWNKTGDRLAIGIDRVLENGSCIEIYDTSGQVLQSLPADSATRELYVLRQGLAWSDDGKKIVACHLDGKARAWNVETGEGKIIDELGEFDQMRSPISWHSSGWLAITNRKEVRIYSPDLLLDQAIPADIGSVRWHPDGRRLLCSGYWVTVWDRIEKKEVLSGEGRIFSGHFPADWSPDGEEVAYVSGESRALSVAPANLKRPRFESPMGNFQWVHSLAWSPDGQTLAQGSDGYVHFWGSDGRMLRRVQNVGGYYLDWSSDSSTLYAGGYEIKAIAKDDAPRDLYLSGRLYTLGSIADSPDGKIVIISRTDGHLQIVDRQGKTIKELVTGGNSIPYVAWCHATNKIAVAEPGQPLKFLDSERGWTLETVGDEPLPHFQAAPIWSPDGSLLSVAPDQWFDSMGQSVRTGGFCEAWRPDGTRFVSGLSLYSPDGSRLMERGPQGNLFSGSYSWHPRGHLFAVGTQQARFTVWNEADFQPYWYGVLLPDNRYASFSAAGELLHGNPEEIDPYLVYYIDRGDGRIETLTPAEFRKLLPEK